VDNLDNNPPPDRHDRRPEARAAGHDAKAEDKDLAATADPADGLVSGLADTALPGRDQDLAAPVDLSAPAADHGPEDDPGSYIIPAGPIVIGQPILRFEPRPVRPSAYDVYRPDAVVDGWATSYFLMRCASLRGYLHRWDGTPRQDDVAVAVHDSTGVLLAAVADGLASAPLSHIGATWACFRAVDWLKGQLDVGVPVAKLSWEDLLTTAAMALVDYANSSLKGSAASVDEASRQLATTLVAAAIVPHGDGLATAYLVGAGDSGAWMLRGGRITPVMNQKLGDAEEIADSSVSFPLPQLSPHAPAVSRVLLSPADVLLIGSDGFGDPLGSGRGQVGRLFARALVRPPDPLAFARLLDFSRENYDDDRTLIAIWPTSPS